MSYLKSPLDSMCSFSLMSAMILFRFTTAVLIALSISAISAVVTAKSVSDERSPSDNFSSLPINCFKGFVTLSALLAESLSESTISATKMTISTRRQIMTGAMYSVLLAATKIVQPLDPGICLYATVQ